MKPGLRFDKVALRLIARVQTTLRDHVPIGNAILVTVSAPIRLPAKTATDLEGQVRHWLTDPSRSAERCTTINGNQIRVRIVNAAPGQSPNVLGFVHNPDVDVSALLDEAQRSLAR
jgi:hypothetical protein